LTIAVRARLSSGPVTVAVLHAGEEYVLTGDSAAEAADVTAKHVQPAIAAAA
jgi:hypothetical protein